MNKKFTPRRIRNGTRAYIVGIVVVLAILAMMTVHAHLQLPSACL